MGFIIDYDSIAREVIRGYIGGAERDTSESALAKEAMIPNKVQTIVRKYFSQIIGVESENPKRIKEAIQYDYDKELGMITINIDGDALIRKPFSKNYFGVNRVYNIINLIATGYSLKPDSATPWGVWRGAWRPALRKRPPYTRVAQKHIWTSQVRHRRGILGFNNKVEKHETGGVRPINYTLSGMMTEIVNAIQEHGLSATVTLDTDFVLPVGESHVRTTLYSG